MVGLYNYVIPIHGCNIYMLSDCFRNLLFFNRRWTIYAVLSDTNTRHCNSNSVQTRWISPATCVAMIHCASPATRYCTTAFSRSFHIIASCVVVFCLRKIGDTTDNSFSQIVYFFNSFSNVVDGWLVSR